MMLSVFPLVLWITCRRYRLIVILYLEHRREAYRKRWSAL